MRRKGIQMTKNEIESLQAQLKYEKDFNSRQSLLKALWRLRSGGPGGSVVPVDKKDELQRTLLLRGNRKERAAGRLTTLRK